MSIAERVSKFNRIVPLLTFVLLLVARPIKPGQRRPDGKGEIQPKYVETAESITNARPAGKALRITVLNLVNPPTKSEVNVLRGGKVVLKLSSAHIANVSFKSRREV